jgi:hypothetical protein
MERKNNPIINRIMFTGMDPTLLLADSNASAVIDQKKATIRAAISP